MTRQGYIYLAVIALLIAVCVASFFNGKKKGFEQAKAAIERRTDTIIVVDTIHHDRPVPVYTHTIDTIRVPYVITNTATDTIYIELPREQKVYRDTSYIAYVSGYRPALDSINIVTRSCVIEHTIIQTAQPRYGIGIQGGYGITPAGFQPYLGVGVQVNLLSFKRH